MSNIEDECRHGLAHGTCSICTGSDPVLARGRARNAGTPQLLDSPSSIEKYRSRYSKDREGTFDAYVDVFFRLDSARNFPGGWTHFSRCANAEPTLVRDEAELVRRAEDLMRLAGYEPDDSGRPARGRRWVSA